MIQPRVVPPADATTQAWWDATRDRRLLIQTCGMCHQGQLYPRATCTACFSPDLGYAEASGRGIIVSYTIVHRAPDPAFTPPYVVALVRLEEGPTVMSNIIGCPPDDVRCDQSVAATWEDLPDGRKLLQFAPTTARGEA